MIWTRVSIGAAAIVSALLTALMVQTLTVDPATLAGASDQVSVTTAVRALAAALVDLFRWLLRYL
jgi:hypothetical protein